MQLYSTNKGGNYALWQNFAQHQYTSGCLEKSIGTKGKLSKDTRDITVLNNVVLEVNREALVLKAIKSTS